MTAKTISVQLPVRIQSEANLRQHFMAVAKRKKAQRAAAHWVLMGKDKPPVGVPVRITITRIGQRALDDDNLQSGCKAIRDGIADWLGVDDGSEQLSWVYQQAIGAKGKYAASITVDWDELT